MHCNSMYTCMCAVNLPGQILLSKQACSGNPAPICPVDCSASADACPSGRHVPILLASEAFVESCKLTNIIPKHDPRLLLYIPENVPEEEAMKDAAKQGDRWIRLDQYGHPPHLGEVLQYADCGNGLKAVVAMFR